jgi:hypothetical protein
VSAGVGIVFLFRYILCYNAGSSGICANAVNLIDQAQAHSAWTSVPSAITGTALRQRYNECE